MVRNAWSQCSLGERTIQTFGTNQPYRPLIHRGVLENFGISCHTPL